MKVLLNGGPLDGTRSEMGEPAELPFELVFSTQDIGAYAPDIIYQRRGNFIDGFYYDFNREEEMEKKILSLRQVWSMRDVGSEPIKVLQRIPSGESADTFCLIGVNNMNQAFGYYEKRPKSLILRTADKDQWFLWTPELVPHWPAITKRMDLGDTPGHGISTGLFPDDKLAQEILPNSFIRLATEYPPIMLEKQG